MQTPTRRITRSSAKPRPIETAPDAQLKAAVVAHQNERFVSARTAALVMLVLQNASVSLLTRLSRTPAAGQAIYAPSVAVFTAEVLKFAVSLAMLARERERSHRRSRRKGSKREGLVASAVGALRELFAEQRGEVVKLAVPAGLYALQNTLLYLSLTNLDAATYQTTYQLKLLTAALFSVLFFRRSLSRTKWLSLFLLTVGVATVQLEGVRQPTTPSRDVRQNPRVGLAAILAACVSSGLAGGWFEYVLKAPVPEPVPAALEGAAGNGGAKGDPPFGPPAGSPTSASSTGSKRTSPALRLRPNSPSLWARNVQLSVSSLTFSAAGIFLCPEWPVLQQRGLWQGFSVLVWSVVVNQALGGLLVAAVVRHADGVAKGFATSIAIVLSTMASVVFFGLVPGLSFLVGAGLVMGSTILYATDKAE